MDTEQEEVKKKERGPLRAVAIATGAGIMMLVFLAISVWAGLRFDAYFGTSPVGLIIGSLFGAVGGLLSVIRQMLEK